MIEELYSVVCSVASTVVVVLESVELVVIVFAVGVSTKAVVESIAVDVGRSIVVEP